MSETTRAASIAIATIASLAVVVMGLAALVETDEPDWELLIIGLVAFFATVPPLLFGGGRRVRGSGMSAQVHDAGHRSRSG